MASKTNILEELETTKEDEVESSGLQERMRERIDLWVIAPARIMWSDRRTRYGMAIIVFYILLGTLGVFIISPPINNEAQPYIGVLQNMNYPLGTNAMGEDLLKKTVHATPAMLEIAFAGGVVTTGIGAVVGVIAGYKGGLTERILMTAADIQMAIPGLPLLIVLAMALEPRDPFIVGFILSIDAWAGLSRQLHSQVLALRSEPYVEASRIMDLNSLSIIQDDILPSVMPYVMINFMRNSTRVINASVGLYFLGVLPFSSINWGVMINLAYNRGALLSLGAVHWLLIPIIAISLLSYGVTIFSQGLDRLFNPRIRARHAESTSDSAAIGDK